MPPIKRKNTLLTKSVLTKMENLNSLNSQLRARFLFDQRKKMQDSLEYLTYMLSYLEEKQKERIFNRKNMMPFLKALFDLKNANPKRILGLWRIILYDITTLNYLLTLVGSERWKILQQLQSPSPIQLIYGMIE